MLSLPSLLDYWPLPRHSPPNSRRFKTQEIDTGLKIGYAVLVADVNGDKKPDIVGGRSAPGRLVREPDLEEAGHPRRQDDVRTTSAPRPSTSTATACPNSCSARLEADRHGERRADVGGSSAANSTTNGRMHPLPCDEPTVHRVRVSTSTATVSPKSSWCRSGAGCDREGQLDRRPTGADHRVQDSGERPREEGELEVQSLSRRTACRPQFRHLAALGSDLGRTHSIIADAMRA